MFPTSAYSPAQLGDVFTVPYRTMPFDGDEIQWLQSMKTMRAVYIPLLIVLNKSERAYVVVLGSQLNMLILRSADYPSIRRAEQAQRVNYQILW